MGILNKLKLNLGGKKVKKTEKQDVSNNLASSISNVPSSAIQTKSSVLASFYLKSPHISEKATNLVKENKYIFRVFPDANKIQIKKAVEAFYGVKVLAVNIINTKPKTKQLGKVSGSVPGYKKAMIQLAQGQKLDILS